jgi:hypothetical protein
MNQVFLSKRWKEMLGFGEEEVADQLSEWDKRVHPDDREAVYSDPTQLSRFIKYE